MWKLAYALSRQQPDAFRRAPVHHSSCSPFSLTCRAWRPRPSSLSLLYWPSKRPRGSKPQPLNQRSSQQQLRLLQPLARSRLHPRHISRVGWSRRPERWPARRILNSATCHPPRMMLWALRQLPGHVSRVQHLNPSPPMRRRHHRLQCQRLRPTFARPAPRPLPTQPIA
jgi:hypothetical protein